MAGSWIPEKGAAPAPLVESGSIIEERQKNLDKPTRVIVSYSKTMFHNVE
jgi:hypothetical protein